ncbi:MAG: glycerophosphodiester phosphodiesterase family protein [Methanophagales archaeon]|nr:glycerophosphodiester phosphodiesterase family protein [Methanophagales archaeon]
MKIIAHRGARAEEPEDTIRAVKRAFECGADAVEIDVRLSKDREIVVIHDDTLERTTNGFGKVDEKTLEQLRTLDAGKGEKIPKLVEALLLAENLGLELVIELKEEGMEEMVVHEIVGAGMEKSVTVSSFYHASLLKIKVLAPRIKTGVIISSLPVLPVKIAIDARAEVIFPKYPRLNREFVAEASKEGIEIYPWTINTREDLEKAIELGVEGVVTDDPCKLKV